MSQRTVHQNSGAGDPLPLALQSLALFVHPRTVLTLPATHKCPVYNTLPIVPGMAGELHLLRVSELTKSLSGQHKERLK